MSTSSGRRRLNLYGRKGDLAHSSSYRCRSWASVVDVFENERRINESMVSRSVRTPSDDIAQGVCLTLTTTLPP